MVKVKTPSTVTFLDELPPLPVHLRVNVLVPFFLIFTDSEPDNDLDPSQSPLAEQLDALVDDHVNVTSWLTSEVLLDEDRFTTGRGVTGADGSLPPPPPPPHDVINIEVRIVINKKLVFFIMSMCFLKI